MSSIREAKNHPLVMLSAMLTTLGLILVLSGCSGTNSAPSTAAPSTGEPLTFSSSLGAIECGARR